MLHISPSSLKRDVTGGLNIFFNIPNMDFDAKLTSGPNSTCCDPWWASLMTFRTIMSM